MRELRHCREFSEETGIPSCTLIPGFKKIVKYFYRRGNKDLVAKTVTYFLGEVTSGKVKLSHESTDFAWVVPEDAVNGSVTKMCWICCMKRNNSFAISRNRLTNDNAICPRSPELVSRSPDRLPLAADTRPYKIWLSEILLQQTRISVALPFYKKSSRAFRILNR